MFYFFFFFFSSRRRHTRFDCDWSSDVCSSDLCSEPACLQFWLSIRTEHDGLPRPFSFLPSPTFHALLPFCIPFTALALRCFQRLAGWPCSPAFSNAASAPP